MVTTRIHVCGLSFACGLRWLDVNFFDIWFVISFVNIIATAAGLLYVICLVLLLVDVYQCDMVP